jgi:hypothetical protein
VAVLQAHVVAAVGLETMEEIVRLELVLLVLQAKGIVAEQMYL